MSVTLSKIQSRHTHFSKLCLLKLVFLFKEQHFRIFESSNIHNENKQVLKRHCIVKLVCWKRKVQRINASKNGSRRTIIIYVYKESICIKWNISIFFTINWLITVSKNSLPSAVAPFSQPPQIPEYTRALNIPLLGVIQKPEYTSVLNMPQVLNKFSSIS